MGLMFILGGATNYTKEGHFSLLCSLWVPLGTTSDSFGSFVGSSYGATPLPLGTSGGRFVYSIRFSRRGVVIFLVSSKNGTFLRFV